MFITIDGPDGTGKTTISNMLEQRMKQAGIPCILTAEPTDSPIGRHIRQLLQTGEATPAQLTELFVLDREQHLKDCVIPHLKENVTVICDRYKYSTICYQHLQGEPLERLVILNGSFRAPDLAVILTVDDAEVLMERIGQRGQARDFFETRETLERALQLYGQMQQFYPRERFLYLDAQNSAKTIVSNILSCINSLK